MIDHVGPESGCKDREAEKSFLAGFSEYPRVVSTIGLARTYSARRDRVRARAEWEKVIHARGEILYDGFPADWVIAHLEAARASGEAGDLAAARRYYDAFLKLWERTDDIAIRQQALGERAAVGHVDAAVPTVKR